MPIFKGMAMAIILLLYLDNMLVIGLNMGRIIHLKTPLGREFDMMDFIGSAK